MIICLGIFSSMVEVPIVLIVQTEQVISLKKAKSSES